MKVLLLKDVYKLGRAGDVKRVAAGYGRNYLIPQGLAVLATPGATKMAEQIRQQAAVRRAELNQELSGVAEQVSEIVLTFPARAGETGKLYGSVTPAMIAEALEEQLSVELDRRSVDTEPIRQLGTHKVNIRLTVDLVPEITVVVHRENERPVLPGEEEEQEQEEQEEETATTAEVEEETVAEGEPEAEAETETETEAEPEPEPEAEE